jgi:lipopolysaccharide biosynthesis glycosyltransferase
MDQDALNFVCNGRWKRLDYRWNFHDCSKSISNLNPSIRPGIFHFVSTQKPWDINAQSVNACFYDTIRSRTRFARTPWDRVKNSIKRIQIHYYQSRTTWGRVKGCIQRLMRRNVFLRTMWQRIRRVRQV